MKLKLLAFFQLLLLYACSQDAKTGSPTNRISAEQFVSINGIEQWVTIKGDTTKPVILFIHGGPGSPMSPYADSMYGKWEKDFVLVQWDQRGAGRTYGKNAPTGLTPDYLKAHPLTIGQMTDDGIALAEYLTRHLQKKKIILFGTSWGSALALKMVIKNPDLFYAYIGHSQMIDPSATAITAYEKVYAMAQEAKDQQALDLLKTIGKPPYESAKSVGQLIRLTKKYQQLHAVPAPPGMFTLSPAYDNSKDDQNRSDGDDYSFVNYAGDKQFGVAPMSAAINFFKDGLDIKIPVYFIQGTEDIQTPPALLKVYFDKLKAPAKKLVMLPGAEHGFNQSVIDTQYAILKQLALQ